MAAVDRGEGRQQPSVEVFSNLRWNNVGFFPGGLNENFGENFSKNLVKSSRKVLDSSALCCYFHRLLRQRKYFLQPPF